MELYTFVHVTLKDICYIYTTTKKNCNSGCFQFFLVHIASFWLILNGYLYAAKVTYFYLKQIFLKDIQNAERKSKEKSFKQDFFRIIWTWFFISVTYPFALQSTESGRSVGSMVGSNKFVLVLLCTIRPFITRANSSLVYKTKEICQIRNLNWLSQRMNYFQT